MHPHVDVFWCCSRKVLEALYVKYIKQGLLDPQHIIGELFYSNWYVLYIGQPHDPQALENFFRINASKGLTPPEGIVKIFSVSQQLAHFLFREEPNGQHLVPLSPSESVYHAHAQVP